MGKLNQCNTFFWIIYEISKTHLTNFSNEYYLQRLPENSELSVVFKLENVQIIHSGFHLNLHPGSLPN